ncbi:MAG: cell division protein FtsH, partial [Bacilli bacterium]
IIGYLGGRTSEEIFFGDVSTGAQNDIEVATRIARMMVTEYGMSALGPIQYESNTGSVFLGRDYNSTQKNFSTQVAFEIDKEVRKIIDDAHEEARKILTEKKQDVIAIAKTLLEKETITAEEISAIITTRAAEEETKKLRKKKENKDA